MVLLHFCTFTADVPGIQLVKIEYLPSTCIKSKLGVWWLPLRGTVSSVFGPNPCISLRIIGFDGLDAPKTNDS